MHGLYPKTPKCLLILYDLTHPGAEERLRREQTAWRGLADVEKLTSESAVLIIQPGAATRLAA